MKLSQSDWARFGRYMMLASGIILLGSAFYTKTDVLSLLFRIWSGIFGAYCIYIGINR